MADQFVCACRLASRVVSVDPTTDRAVCHGCGYPLEWKGNMLTDKVEFRIHGLGTEADPHGFKEKTRVRGTCACGRRIEVLHDDTDCECGRYYNLSGQELVPPDQREPEDSDDDIS